MIRAFAVSTFVAGVLVIGLSSGRAVAAGVDGVAIPPGKPVQSNTSTASSGRRPLAVRIAMADKRKADEPALARSTTASPAVTRPEPAAAAADTASVESSPTPNSAEADDAATETLAVPTPAVRKLTIPRLLVDCEESMIDARHGESIRWRITIRNAGSDAHDVLATLYFAEGIEPTAAKGHGHAVAAGEVRFSPFKTLGTDDAIQLEVTGRAVQPGSVAYRIEVGCRDLPGHVAREAVILVRPKPAN